MQTAVSLVLYVLPRLISRVCLFKKAAVLSVSNNNTSMSLRGADANLTVMEGLYDAQQIYFPLSNDYVFLCEDVGLILHSLGVVRATHINLTQPDGLGRKIQRHVNRDHLKSCTVSQR